MASIYLFNPKGGKCVELKSSQIETSDIDKLRDLLPPSLEGIAFEPESLESYSHESMRVETDPERISEYLKGIAQKLEGLQQNQGAVCFYDLAFRLHQDAEVLLLKANLLSAQGFVEKAERLLRKFVEKYPEEPFPYYVFGKNALSRSDFEKARQYFQMANDKIREQNVEHKNLLKLLNIYTKFVGIYSDRDQLFTRDLAPDRCCQEVQALLERTQSLSQEIAQQQRPDLEGMVFYLENQSKVFEKWLREMRGEQKN